MTRYAAGRMFFQPESSLVTEVVRSDNHGERAGGKLPDMIVLHYTGMADSEAALQRLCTPQSEVSAHYFVWEDGRILQCVPEGRRAWHAGDSFWAGETDINSCSIGVEIANPGHDLGYPDFPLRQVAATIALCRGIVIRRQIPPARVLAHSDVAPGRKRDPGEKFPWALMHGANVGNWVEPAPITSGPSFQKGDRNQAIERMQAGLAEYGYGIKVTGEFDQATSDVVTAFQRHFRPAKVDGIADSSTLVTLRNLLEAGKRAALTPARPLPKSAASVGWTAAPAGPKGRWGGKSGLHG
jgi:N-acetylmuramoyl-L-alanine amidase